MNARSQTSEHSSSDINEAFAPKPNQLPCSLEKAGAQGFHRLPGETPRAFSAFLAYFALGHVRSLYLLATKMSLSIDTLKKWSSKFNWGERILTIESGLLEEQAAAQRAQAAEWARRLADFREQEWQASQKLLSAAQCFLENFGDEDLSRMTLSQAARALRISSDMGRLAISGGQVPPDPEPALSPVQNQILEALARLSSPPSQSGPADDEANITPTVVGRANGEPSANL